MRYRFGLAALPSIRPRLGDGEFFTKALLLGGLVRMTHSCKKGPGQGSIEGVHEGLLRRNRHGEPVPYSRGKASEALDAISQPSKCKELLLADSRAIISVGPVESRLKLWEKLSRRARLEPLI